MAGKLTLLFLAALVAPIRATTRQASPAGNTRGTLSAENVYENTALGFRLKLPGWWKMQDRGAARGAPAAGCTGPLCGDADIDVAMQSIGNDSRRYRIFLAAWKLAPEYKDRSRYPLKWFADIMLTGSLGRSEWTPVGSLTAVQLDGHPLIACWFGIPMATVREVSDMSVNRTDTYSC